MSSRRTVPAPPRVISPTPTPTDETPTDYFDSPSTRRRSTRLQSKATPSPDPDARARSKTRDSLRTRRQSTKATAASDAALNVSTPPSKSQQNGLLSPGALMRSLSRSPSPLGLIPIHTSWRHTIHKHELPRKALHVSIGFVTLALYARGAQPAAIHPALLYALVPIAATDILRHNVAAVNSLYVRLMGAFMRESEVHDRYNGVIFYLAGAWAVLRFAPKDVGVVAIVLLSWCDTAASTAGRALGRYTPQVRRGKSLAGSLAAALVGAVSAALFWGYIGPAFAVPHGPAANSGENAFAYRGWLALPQVAGGGRIVGGLALGVLSAVAGVIASASEAVDLWGLDDNVSIPVLCGIGLWGFLRVFGGA